MYRHCIYLIIIHSIYIYTTVLVPCWMTMKNDPFVECKCGHLVFLMDRCMECIGAGRVPCSFVGAGYRSDVSRRGSLSKCLSYRYFTAPTTIMQPVHRVQQHHNNNSIRRLNLQVLYMIYTSYTIYY